MSNARNLTGVWHGLYNYPHDNKGVSFVATLIETGSMLSGTTHEPCRVGPPGTLYATLTGVRRDRAVSFAKTYDGSNPFYRIVQYEGALSDDGNEIEGRWLVPGSWSGRFLMIRPEAKSATVSRKAAVRA